MISAHGVLYLYILGALNLPDYRLQQAVAAAEAAWRLAVNLCAPHTVKVCIDKAERVPDVHAAPHARTGSRQDLDSPARIHISRKPQAYLRRLAGAQAEISSCK